MPIRKIRPLVMFMCFFCFALAEESSAQNLATVAGRITDETGAVVENAHVELVNKATGASVSASSDGAGSFYFSNLVPGHYLIVVESAGFAVYHAETDAGFGQSSQLNIRLALRSTQE